MTGKKTEAASVAAQSASSPTAGGTPPNASQGGGGAGQGMPVRRRSSVWGAVVLALIVGLALGAAGGRYWFKDQATRRYDTLKQQLEGELVVARVDLAKAQAHADALSGSLLVEQGTRKGLETSLEGAQAELGRTREQLAFFDKLFPPGPKGAVSIRALDAELHGHTLRYRALFMRNAVNAPKFEGHMQFVAKGHLNGKAETITLQPARGVTPTEDAPAEAKADVEADTDSFALMFDEFQRSMGLLDVPEGFVPAKLTLNVLEGDAVRATRTIDLSVDE